jgi:hypothetical protein
MWKVFGSILAVSLLIFRIFFHAEIVHCTLSSGGDRAYSDMGYPNAECFHTRLEPGLPDDQLFMYPVAWRNIAEPKKAKGHKWRREYFEMNHATTRYKGWNPQKPTSQQDIMRSALYANGFNREGIKWDEIPFPTEQSKQFPPLSNVRNLISFTNRRKFYPRIKRCLFVRYRDFGAFQSALSANDGIAP